MTTRMGTLRRFVGDASMVVVAVEREPGNIAALPVESRVAHALVARYGARTGGVVDMSPVIGKRVEYQESAVGLVTRLDVLTEE